MNKFEKNFFPIREHWDFVFIFLFLVIRLILNLKFNMLPIFFAGSYLIILFLMFTHRKAFFVFTISFLFVDGLIGTVLYTSSGNLGIEYFGTMFFNLVIILLLTLDFKGKFLK